MNLLVAEFEELRISTLPVGFAVWAPLDRGWWPARVIKQINYSFRIVEYFERTFYDEEARKSVPLNGVFNVKELRDYTSNIEFVNQSGEVFSACIETNIWIRTYGKTVQKEKVEKRGFLTEVVVSPLGSVGELVYGK